MQNGGSMHIEMGRVEMSVFVFILFKYCNQGSKVFILINARHRATIRTKTWYRADGLDRIRQEKGT